LLPRKNDIVFTKRLIIVNAFIYCWREVNTMDEISRVVIPVDRSEASRIAVEQGSHLAKLLGVDVAIISVDASQQFIASTALESRLRKEHENILDVYKKIVEQKEINTQAEIIVGDAPAEEIIRYAEDNDLIVMASHSKKGMERFLLGSVSEKVLQKVNCHVMVLKPKITEDRHI
jgi:nucleotide-binding universal stress UspA family protein